MSQTLYDAPLLKPIALRQRDQSAHPFDNLRLRANEYRIEATAKIENLERVIDSLHGVLKENDALLAKFFNERDNTALDTQSERAPQLVHAALVNMLVVIPEHGQRLAQCLAELEGLHSKPQLVNLKDTLVRVYGYKNKQAALVLDEAQELRDGPAKLCERLERLHDSLRAFKTQVDKRVPKQQAAAYYRIGVFLEKEIWRATKGPTEHHSTKGVEQILRKGMEWEAKHCGSGWTLDIKHAVVGIAKDTLSWLLAYEQLRNRIKKCAESTVELADQVATVFSMEDRALFANFLTQTKPFLIEAAFKNYVSRHLDPVNRDADSVNTDRWLPAALRPTSQNLGVSERGELVATSEKGDPSALIAAVATLIDTKDPSLYREGHINNRLAPVIRAALPKAYELVAEWATARAQEEEQRVLLERAKIQAANEAREFVEYFFEDTFASSLPQDALQREEVRKKFLSMYPDSATIDARQDRLVSISRDLSFYGDEFTKHHECYLLDDHQLDRWSKQAQEVKARMLRSRELTDHELMGDPLNFLPSTLSTLSERRAPTH
jgi:hypothetical protein